MLTNKDELITVLTNLLDKFYSDEKNKISERKNSDPTCINGAEKGTATSKKGFRLVNEDRSNGNVSDVQTSTKVYSLHVNGECGNVANTHGSNGEVAVCMSDSPNKISIEAHRTSICLDENALFEETKGREYTCSEQAKDNAGCHLSDNAPPNTTGNGNSSLREASSCHEGANPNNQGKCKYPSPAEIKISANTNYGHVDQAAHIPSAQQEDANTLAKGFSFLTDSFDSTELSEAFGDKTLCKISESDIKDNVHNSSKTSTEQSSVAGIGNFDITDSHSYLNSEDQRKESERAEKIGKDASGLKVVNADGCSEKNHDAPRNAALTSTPSMSQSVENLFSLDFDDLFDDSDLNVTGADSNMEASGALKSSEMPSPGVNKVSVSGEKSLTGVPPGTAEARCRDKDWSMGRGIVDKQGKPVEVLYITNFESYDPPSQKQPLPPPPQKKKRKNNVKTCC